MSIDFTAFCGSGAVIAAFGLRCRGAGRQKGVFSFMKKSPALRLARMVKFKGLKGSFGGAKQVPFGYGREDFKGGLSKLKREYFFDRRCSDKPHCGGGSGRKQGSADAVFML